MIPYRPLTLLVSWSYPDVATFEESKKRVIWPCPKTPREAHRPKVFGRAEHKKKKTRMGKENWWWLKESFFFSIYGHLHTRKKDRALTFYPDNLCSCICFLTICGSNFYGLFIQGSVLFIFPAFSIPPPINLKKGFLIPIWVMTIEKNGIVIDRD